MALAISAIALVKACRDPLGAGLSKHDFSSPKAALISHLEASLNGDFRAEIELQSQTRSKAVKEKLDTLQVASDADFQGKKILFVSFKENGLDKHDVETFEKHADTGLWVPTYLGTFDIEESNTALAQQIKRWQTTGQR